jgi:hypothetical protein
MKIAFKGKNASEIHICYSLQMSNNSTCQTNMFNELCIVMVAKCKQSSILTSIQILIYYEYTHCQQNKISKR